MFVFLDYTEWPAGESYARERALGTRVLWLHSLPTVWLEANHFASLNLTPLIFHWRRCLLRSVQDTVLQNTLLIVLISTQPEKVAGTRSHSFNTCLFVAIARKAPHWALRGSLWQKRRRSGVQIAGMEGLSSSLREPLTWESFLSMIIFVKKK